MKTKDSGYKVRMPSRYERYYSSVPSDLPQRYIAEWLMGSFLFQLSSLESVLTNWLIVALDPYTEHYGYVVLRDENFSHKIKLFRFFVERKMTYSRDFKLDAATLEKISGIRNQFAHGVIEEKEDMILISMPARDYLNADRKNKYEFEYLLRLINDMSTLCSNFYSDSESHFNNFNKIRREKLPER
jgi:hypothetical protein